MISLDWDNLPPLLWRAICQEVGVDEGAADEPAAQLDVDRQELISWSHEVIQRVRIIFTSPGKPLN
jgi:hypothetical protein